ncbi:quinoprotein dehydrogenase-associated SoxYZ-like carrier [Dinoroseobacter sp. PD6]|uniref:quinoprotein dehydrogenase-associated SoxYZ-like carrier n=1 Tax=Dinoroseobacter sp. PD6 TaxID=3028384 RepID=UPI00237A51E3|nr:quinoprotein dehydrogenase-associated SoxYZ-like carrier [Dinoroseobacter sp. PD6]MDD9717427.1 quinoprotein dehydrogenase-associated SoxYZ-like carrier [Dinoroseobacter sp. PD6]
MTRLTLTTALLCCTALPALAGAEAWDDIRAALYGDRLLLDGAKVIAIDAPYRTPDDARTDLAAQIIPPLGTEVSKVWVVLDENPMPVSAVFELKDPQPSFFFDVTMRVNGPTPLHVVAETSDGRLFVQESFVKTSGTGACAAPPGTDPIAALTSLGEIDVSLGSALPGIAEGELISFASRLSRMDVDISHPSHSGMQRDQISLLFIPMRYVESVDIDLDESRFVEMTGSISLSENPRVGLSIPSSSRSVDVTMTDTDGTVSKLHQKLAGY